MVLALLACPIAIGAAPARGADAALLALGRSLCDAFERGDTASLWARMTSEARASYGSMEALAELRERVIRDDGPETGVIREDTEVSGPHRIYRRIARRNVGQTPTMMEWTVDRDDRIVELAIRPYPIAIPSGKSNY